MRVLRGDSGIDLAGEAGRKNFEISRWFSEVNRFIFGLRAAEPPRIFFEILVEFSSAKTSFLGYRPAPPAENFEIFSAKTVFFVHLSRRSRPKFLTER